jgi:hypothetical protein
LVLRSRWTRTLSFAVALPTLVAFDSHDYAFVMERCTLPGAPQFVDRRCIEQMQSNFVSRKERRPDMTDAATDHGSTIGLFAHSRARRGRVRDVRLDEILRHVSSVPPRAPAA